MDVKIIEQNNEKVLVVEDRVDMVTAPELEMKVSPVWAIPDITLVGGCTIKYIHRFFILPTIP